MHQDHNRFLLQKGCLNLAEESAVSKSGIDRPYLLEGRLNHSISVIIGRSRDIDERIRHACAPIRQNSADCLNGFPSIYMA